MDLSVKEFAELTGVSVRTLHYYDEIGLLCPARTDPETRYRYYDETCLQRMQQILFFRELEFPLKTVRAILSAPDYEKTRALEEQKTLLLLKKKRLENLIAAIDGAKRGENVMAAFDNREYEAYKAEAKARWGNTDAYKAYEKKSEARSVSDGAALTDGMDAIMKAFAECRQSGAAPDSAEAGSLVDRLRAYITERFYPCTAPILLSLGQMYVQDERFRQNIDRHGEGTAAFIRDAIFAHFAKERDK